MNQENWVKEDSKRMTQTAAQTLKKIKADRKGKKYRMVRVDARTYKEIEIKD